jgi:YidC/Oxa1 family membrane protein insertase
MDNIRLFLWMALLGTLWLSYSTWTRDYAPAPTPVATQASGADSAQVPVQAADSTLPQLGQAESPDVAATVAQVDGAAPAPTRTIRVQTDVLDLQINLQGGDIVRADLPEYPVDKSDPDTLVRLLDYAANSRWVFQIGLRDADGGSEPNHLAQFSSDADSYVLSGGADELSVALTWSGANGISATKTYTFKRGSYEIDLDLHLQNGGATAWRGAAYSQMVRLHRPVERSFVSVDSYSYTGPVLYDGDRYEKLQVDDLLEEPLEQTRINGWFAGIQHHFLAAIVPPAEQQTRYQAVARGSEYVLTGVGPVQTVAAGAALDYALRLFVGPKLQEQLRATSNELDLTVDYGILTVLAQPLFRILSFVHDWVGNWGWAIILVTAMIKLVFYKLTATSGRSMAKMRKLAPRMKSLQERHKDDRQALSAAMMDLYKREKVNPAAGCLPILIQMPFFFAFYWVLIESVEMRQAPFMLWINDLSVRDPFFILPLLMGAAMFFQTRLNPAPPDPIQARVMQIMPIVFTGFFAFFPAGLVLYWLTNTVLSMLQQWRINTIVAREGTAKTA